jgi:hypothetical protein
MGSANGKALGKLEHFWVTGVVVKWMSRDWKGAWRYGGSPQAHILLRFGQSDCVLGLQGGADLKLRALVPLLIATVSSSHCNLEVMSVRPACRRSPVFLAAVN